MIEWEKTTSDEVELIQQIVRRLEGVVSFKFDPLTFFMDIQACHLATPLQLCELLGADDFDFCHDVIGIVQYIDRTTGKLKDCFTPRYLVREE